MAQPASKPARSLQSLPNVGPAMARDLTQLGIHSPEQLKGKDPYRLFRKLEQVSGHRQDPCVLDTFMSIVDFANGAPAKPWFAYTAARKQKYGHLLKPVPASETSRRSGSS